MTTSQVKSQFMNLFQPRLEPILSEFKIYQPEQFKEQIHLVERGSSFLTRLAFQQSFITPNTLSISDLDFLIKEGYDFLKPLDVSELEKSYPISSFLSFLVAKNEIKSSDITSLLEWDYDTYMKLKQDQDLLDRYFNQWGIEPHHDILSDNFKIINKKLTYLHIENLLFYYRPKFAIKQYTPFTGKIDSTLMCDYLGLFNQLPKETLTHLTQHLLTTQPEKLHQFVDAKYNLVNKAISSNNIPLLELLLKNGFSISNKEEDKDWMGNLTYDYLKLDSSVLLKVQPIIDKYISQNSKSSNSSYVNFENSLAWLNSNANRESLLNNYISYLEYHLPLFSGREKEQLIASSFLANDSTVVTKVLKIIGKNAKTYQPAFYPLWRNLPQSTHHSFFHYFFEKASVSPLDYYVKSSSELKKEYQIFSEYDALEKELNQDNILFKSTPLLPFEQYSQRAQSFSFERSFIAHALQYAKKSNVNLAGRHANHRSYGNSVKSKRDRKINYVMSRILTDNIWIQTFSGTTDNLFSWLSSHPELASYSYSLYQTITDLPAKHLRDSGGYPVLGNEEEGDLTYAKKLLNATWFKPVPKHADYFQFQQIFSTEIAHRLLSQTPLLIQQVATREEYYELLTPTQKMALLSTLLIVENNRHFDKVDKHSEIFDSLLPFMAQDTSLDWSKFKFYPDENTFSKKYPTLLSNLKKIQFGYQLNQDLSTSVTNISKPKI